MRVRYTILALTGVLIAATPALAQQTIEQQFGKYLAGNTTHFITNGRNGYVYYRTAEKPELWIKETKLSDKGTITFRDAETYCASWEKVRNGANRCFKIKSITETKVVVEAIDNGETTEASIVKGNPQGF